MIGRDPLANPAPLIRRVYAYVAYRVGDGPNAEDITSQTFERALRYRESYDHRRAQPVTWLLGIARNCIAEALNTRHHLLADPGDAVAPGDLAAEAARRLDVHAALRRLSANEQELIALRYGADLTARQIGELLGLRPGTVRVALHRALDRLRSDLEGVESDRTLRPVGQLP